MKAVYSPETFLNLYMTTRRLIQKLSIVTAERISNRIVSFLITFISLSSTGLLQLFYSHVDIKGSCLLMSTKELRQVEIWAGVSLA
jgi:hypothetical protein